MKKFFSYLNTECPLFIKKSSKITLVIATLAITIFITLKSSSISYAQNAFPTSYPNYNNYATNLFDETNIAVTPGSGNYPDIRVHVEKGYEYEQQWINENFDYINKTAPKFLELINTAGVDIYVGVNENGNPIHVSQTSAHKMYLHNVSQNIKSGFVTILNHEMSHVIDKNNTGDVSGRSLLWSAVVADAGGNPNNYVNGLLTNYAKHPESCNSNIGVGNTEVQLGEDYAEMFAYYLNPNQTETTGCGINNPVLPYANGTHSAHKSLVEHVLFGKPINFKQL